MAIILRRTTQTSAITHEEIDQIRTEQALFYPDLVTIRRKLYDENDFVTQTVGIDIPARLYAEAGVFKDVADRLQAVNPYTLTVAYDQDLQAADQVIDVDSNVFEVRSVRDPKSYQTAKRALLELVT